MRALSIRQPYAELILPGINPIEYRSRPTRIIGERFWICVPLKPGDPPGGPEGFATLGAKPEDLPTGVIVGAAVISHVTNGGTGASAYEWHLTDVQRIARPRKPKGQPQPVWFRPF